MKKLLWILSIILVLGLGFLFLVKNPQSIISQKVLPMIGLERFLTGTTTTLNNPASVFCLQNSGISEIVTDLTGGQSGVCHLLDGTTCDERTYFRGECPTTGTDLTGTELTGTIETGGLIDQVNQEVTNQQTGQTINNEIISDILRKMTVGKNILQNLGKTANVGMYTINVVEGKIKDQLEIIYNGTDKKYVDLPYEKACEGGDTGPCGKFGIFKYGSDRYVFFTYITYNEDAGLVALDLDSLSIVNLFQVTDNTIFDTTQNGDQFFIGNSQSFDPEFRITYKNDISKNKSIGIFKVYGYVSDNSYLYLETSDELTPTNDDRIYENGKKFLRKIDLNTLQMETTQIQ